MPSSAHRPIALWLLGICALIFAMVVLGGVTRLSHSGLSIVEWQPIEGTLPPFTEGQWLETFAKYQQTPEYRTVNSDMTLAGFKGIFWLEYFHRLLGRIIGLAFLLPFLYFLVRKKIDRRLLPTLIILFSLGAAQGLLGWVMVKSGLVDIPRVSPYRLTAHLSLAIIIYAATLWAALGLLDSKPSISASAASVKSLRRMGLAVTGFIFLMIITGGFVAGTRAGFTFNDWPRMHGQWVPDSLFALQPTWVNVFENLATVQFNHRLLAYLLCLLVPFYWWLAARYQLPSRTRRLFHLLPLMLAIQVTLGIATLLGHVPLPLAAAHQAGALALFTIAILINHRLRD